MLTGQLQVSRCCRDVDVGLPVYAFRWRFLGKDAWVRSAGHLPLNGPKFLVIPYLN